MRALAIVGITFAVVGVVFYWKRDAIEDWASTFAADRIVHAIEAPDAPGPDDGDPLGIEQYGKRLAKDVGRKVLAKVDGATLAQRIIGR